MTLAEHQSNITRGYHQCEFCDEKSPISFSAPSTPNGSVILGHGEIHVRGDDGTFYFAPALIIHYIANHHYWPPEVFQMAVLVEAKARARQTNP